MKTALHLVLAAALLLQGALAVAMPIPAPAASMQSSMPCHGDHLGKKSMPCCAHNECACQAICSAIALPIAVTSQGPHETSGSLRMAARSFVRAAFRLTPLRPPIELSA